MLVSHSQKLPALGVSSARRRIHGPCALHHGEASSLHPPLPLALDLVREEAGEPLLNTEEYTRVETACTSAYAPGRHGTAAASAKAIQDEERITSKYGRQKPYLSVVPC